MKNNCDCDHDYEYDRIKVIIEKSRGGVFLMGQDTIEKSFGEYPHLVTIDPQHAGINTVISGGFSSVERRTSS